MTRTLTVAAIQCTSIDGEVERNLANAEPLVRSAAEQGATLILCPEFLGAGYFFDEALWEGAEPVGGPTETWLERLARQTGALVGAGFLEAEGEEFFNTFSLFGPDGLVGRVRKGSLPFFEGWYFQPCSLPKLIETDIGKIGVGICNDTQTAQFYQQMVDARPDLILMPHSAPTPRVPIIDRLFRPAYDQQLRSIPQRYARALGVPVVMANKVSFSCSRSPIPIVPGLRVAMQFRGFSAICDGDGRVVAELVDAEAPVVGEVTLGRAGSESPTHRARGYWSFAPTLFPRATGALLRGLAAMGQRAYRRNPRRGVAAQRRSGAGSG